MPRADWIAAERAWSRREESMGFGRWTRWGRNSCEGYSIEFGHLLRFNVLATAHEGASPCRWGATMGSRPLGDFATFEEAIAKCDDEARDAMRRAVEDWERFQVQAPAKRSLSVRRR